MSKLSHAGYGMSNSPAAYMDPATGKFTGMPPAPELALHEYRPTKDGGLEHYIDGELRAIVAPADLADYKRTWPASGELAGDRGAQKSKGEELTERGAAAQRPDDDPADDDAPTKKPKKKR